MVEEASERVKKFTESVFTTGSRAKAPRENEISSPLSPQNDLLIAVIVLGIIVFALILIIIYGYCKYVSKGFKTEGRNRSTNLREDVEQPSSNQQQQQQQQQQHTAEVSEQPVKTRKRSMTFSETDEECRKYREDLADSHNNTDADRTRKKSVVTFVGVKEIDGDES